MTRSAIELALEMARHTVACVDQTVADLRPHYENKNETIIARALLALAEQNAAMVAVVNGAIESYRELGALDLRVGDVVDEDDVRCWEAHERAIGVPLRAYLTTPSPPATEQEK